VNEHSLADSDVTHAVTFSSLPDGEHVLELWLSNVCPQVVQRLALTRGAMTDPVADARPVWITHGSSITRCMGFDAFQFPGLPYGSSSAHSPSRTWPALAARAAADVSFLSLGFGGQCNLDPMVTRLIAVQPRADGTSLKLGINEHNTGCMGYVLSSHVRFACSFLDAIKIRPPTRSLTCSPARLPACPPAHPPTRPQTRQRNTTERITAQEGFLLTVREGHPRTRQR
jgi:hypothetical protein